MCHYYPLRVTGQNGYNYGGIPAHTTEHTRSNIVLKIDLDSRKCWSGAVTDYHLVMLLLCKWEWLYLVGVAMLSLQTMLTAISMSAIATNGVVPGTRWFV